MMPARFLTMTCLLSAAGFALAGRDLLQESSSDGGAAGGPQLLSSAVPSPDQEAAPVPAAEAAAPTAPPATEAAGLTAPLEAEAPALAPGECSSQLNYSSVFMPPDAQLQLRLLLNGTRNYTCVGAYSSVLQFAPAMGIGTLTGEYTCRWSYANPFTGRVDCSDPTTGAYVGGWTLDTTVRGTVFVLPAPDASGSDEPWGRFKVKVDGSLPEANYSVRYNTTGGVRPQQCTAPPGKWVTVPITAVIELYWCP